MEKFSNKGWYGVRMKLVEDIMKRLNMKEKRGTEKCRGWDLNPRTPKGRDIL